MDGWMMDDGWMGMDGESIWGSGIEDRNGIIMIDDRSLFKWRLFGFPHLPLTFALEPHQKPLGRLSA
jgi:hypothetical protein